VGTAATNKTSDEALAQAAERALLHAQRQPENPDFPGLADPQPIEPAHAFDQATASLPPEARAQAVNTICALAAGHHFSASGAFSTASDEIAVASSRGVLAYHASTRADLQTVMTGEDGTGRAQASSWKAGDVDAEAIGREAVDKTARAQHPRKIEPGEYTVVVDPYVTADLIQMLNLTGMSAQAVQEGRSWMNDRIGQPIMSPLVSIWDDGHDLAGIPLPFDFEGVPRRRVQIVERGVVCGPVYDRATAKKDGRESTGHATPPNMRFVSGPLAFNLFVAAGDSSIDDMIRSTERGLYITRFWYTRPVHPRDCIVTGMTRDGLYRIENGERTYAVKNLRFTQSYVAALANVQAVSRERRTLAEEFGGARRVPALKIEAFNFTGSTV
jgi:predicted Zn-dependent protease